MARTITMFAYESKVEPKYFKNGILKHYQACFPFGSSLELSCKIQQNVAVVPPLNFYINQIIIENFVCCMLCALTVRHGRV